jgi:hypothetical protein
LHGKWLPCLVCTANAHIFLQVVNVPKAQLGTIQDAVITTGDAVKSQINGTISGARGSVNNLKGQVVGQLSNVEETYKPLVRQVDGYRCGYRG